MTVALLTLVGCATRAVREQDSAVVPVMISWPQQRDALQRTPGFELKGRFAVAAAGEGYSGAIRWRQVADAMQINIDGPFGVGGMEIVADRLQFMLTTSRGEVLRGSDARSAMERQLGFPLPIETLRYWVLGVPAPGSASTEQLDADRLRLSQLTQDGWHVEFGGYARTPAGERPNRMVAMRDGARVRLVVQSWTAVEHANAGP